EILSATGLDTLEFIGRLRMSDVSASTLDAIRTQGAEALHPHGGRIVGERVGRIIHDVTAFRARR
ncbi:hypothetical protein ACWELJ_33745, partial [Nocardia sp. NPDC004582]